MSGNPVSCYGKRALSPDYSIEQNEGEKQMENYERFAELLIASCRNGNDKSCSAILEIMLLKINLNLLPQTAP